MIELLGSFFAGFLTVAAPCVLPLLPVILGGSIVRTEQQASSKAAPYQIIAGLIASVIVFTLLLKASTALLNIPDLFWQAISASILVLFGMTLVLPQLWDTISVSAGLQKQSDALLNQSAKKQGVLGNFLIGAALGPVFNSCSPTYALIVAIILPRSFAEGFVHLTAYALGLGIALLAIALLGKKISSRLRSLANPQGIVRRGIGFLFILIGLAILFGYDKKIQTFALEHGWYDPISKLERSL